MPIELKPCPFCGGEAEINPHSFWNEKEKDFTDKTFGVVCVGCQTSGNQFYSTEAEAAEAWNRRADDATD